MEDENKLLCLQNNMLNQNCFIMGKYEKWKKGRTNHLAEWLRRDNKTIESGKFRNYNHGYPYILPLIGNGKKAICDAIERYHVLTNNVTIKGTGLIKDADIHRYAHHLNSSQILCYNYFCLHTDLLGKLLSKYKLSEILEKNLGINISDSAVYEFEYKDDKSEGTSFDFHIKDDKLEIFFEIKYTENGFGKATDDDKHRNKFEEIYKTYLHKQKVCREEVIFEQFRTNYQLFRNVIRVTGKNKYVVFIYPKGNVSCDNQFKEFEQGFLTGELKDNVKRIYWEDLITKDSDPELFEKYFAE
jgi:hypothetical protein